LQQLAKTILPPSGDQVPKPALSATFRCALPSTFITCREALSGPPLSKPTVRVKRTLRPSGDQDDADPRVSLRCAVPSPFITQSSGPQLRALRVLRDEGLLEFRRGRGISVAGTPERGAVVQRARELVDFARRQGYGVDELVEIIEDVA
jgi:hypothetical protein